MGVMELRPGGNGPFLLGDPEVWMRELDVAVDRLNQQAPRSEADVAVETFGPHAPRKDRKGVPTIPLHIVSLAEEARCAIAFEGVPEHYEELGSPRRGWTWDEWQKIRDPGTKVQVSARQWVRWSAAGVGLGLLCALALYGALSLVPRFGIGSAARAVGLIATVDHPLPSGDQGATPVQAIAASANVSARAEADAAPQPAPTAVAAAAFGVPEIPTFLAPLRAPTEAPAPAAVAHPAAPIVSKAAAAPEKPRALGAVMPSQQKLAARADPQLVAKPSEISFEDDGDDLAPEPVAKSESEPAFDDPADADFDREFGVAASSAPAAAVGTSRTVYLPPDPAAPAEGTLTPEQIMGVVVAHKDEISTCVEAFRKTSPDAEGELVMAWTIAANGTPSAVQTQTASLRGSALAGCVEERIRGFRFPAHSGKQPPVVFPFRY